jgi:molybdopterin converting factor small subunit
MALFKLCSQGHKNSPDAIMCQECLEDLSRLEPMEIAEPDSESSDDLLDVEVLDVDIALDNIDLEAAEGDPILPPTVTLEEDSTLVLFPEAFLTFQTTDGQTFTATSGDIIGRAETGSDILQFFPTVSRLHFRLFQREWLWHIKNLSDNGTYLNGREIAVGEETPLNAGDELRLSTKCRLMVLP